MKELNNILLIGQIIVDVTVASDNKEPKLRLGGIIHAARALWSIDCPYGLAYIAPDYLDCQIHKYANSIGTPSIHKIGTVIGAPNVQLICEPKEFGPQGYEYLLRDELKVLLNEENIIKTMDSQKWSDVLIFPGGFDLTQVLRVLDQNKSRIHIDANYEPKDWRVLKKRKIETIILSTSSEIFHKEMQGKINILSTKSKKVGANTLLFKENRGGSRFFNFNNPNELPINIPAQIRTVEHSVGVGDCFDAIFTVLRNQYSNKQALAYAACIAAEYASTTKPEVFKKAVKSWLNISADEIDKLQGISLPWEKRRNFQIYIAAPDFDFIDRRPINQLLKCLEYHNFSPRCPIRESGQMEENASIKRKQELFQNDMRLLNKCSILIAVLLYNDPGTLIESGIAYGRKIPVIVYDPFHRAKNLILTELPCTCSSDLDEIICSVFQQIQKVSQND